MKLIIATIALIILMIIAGYFRDVIAIDVCMALAYLLGFIMSA